MKPAPPRACSDGYADIDHYRGLPIHKPWKYCRLNGTLDAFIAHLTNDARSRAGSYLQLKQAAGYFAWRYWETAPGGLVII